MAPVSGVAGSGGEMDGAGGGGDGDDAGGDVVDRAGDGGDAGGDVVDRAGDGGDAGVVDGRDVVVESRALVFCSGDSNVVDSRCCRSLGRKEDAFFCGKIVRLYFFFTIM